MPSTPKSQPRKVDPEPHPGSTGTGHLSLVEAKKYTIKQAAKMVGISETMMRNEVRNGSIPVIQIGTKSVIVEWDLEDYLRGHYGAMQPFEVSDAIPSRLPREFAESPLINRKRKSA